MAGARVHLRVALIGISMMLLGGDDVVIDIVVGAGVVLEVVEPAGLVAYDAADQPSRWSMHAVIGEGGALIWDGAPFVGAAGSNTRRSVEVSLGPGARALLRETTVLGRSSEEGGRLRVGTRLTGPEGEYLVEDLDLTSVSRRAVGVLGDAKVMGVVTAVGWRPPSGQSPPPRTAITLELAREGAMLRVLARTAHEAEAVTGHTMHGWRNDLLTLGPKL